MTGGIAVNHFSLQVPAAQIVLDNHTHARKQQEIANNTVIDAVRTYAEFSEVVPHLVFGCAEATFGTCSAADRANVADALASGMPIYDIRIATAEFADALSPGGMDEAFQVMLGTFEAGVPVSSLAGSGALTASQAILAVNSHVRKKIEIANNAILDAVKAYVDAGDPMAPYVFGVPRRVLNGLADTSRAKLARILMTGIPIFSLRSTTAAANESGNGDGADDTAILQLLKSFSSTLLAA